MTLCCILYCGCMHIDRNDMWDACDVTSFLAYHRPRFDLGCAAQLAPPPPQSSFEACPVCIY